MEARAVPRNTTKLRINQTQSLTERLNSTRKYFITVHSALRLYHSCNNQVQPTQQVKSSLS